jgi:hypothetical protein
MYRPLVARYLACSGAAAKELSIKTSRPDGSETSAELRAAPEIGSTGSRLHNQQMRPAIDSFLELARDKGKPPGWCPAAPCISGRLRGAGGIREETPAALLIIPERGPAAFIRQPGVICRRSRERVSCLPPAQRCGNRPSSTGDRKNVTVCAVRKPTFSRSARLPKQPSARTNG